MEIITQIVDFEAWCPSCEHYEKSGEDYWKQKKPYPCDDCMEKGGMEHTNKPLRWKEKRKPGRTHI